MKKQRTWRSWVREYINHRRSFGCKFDSVDRILFHFADHLDQTGFKGALTRDVQLDWITRQEGKTSFNRARKLSTIRFFAKYLFIFDPKTEVPEARIFGSSHSPEFECHIYTAKEIENFFNQLKRPFVGESPFFTTTYRHAFGLILACGLRASEVTKLLDKDVDLENGMINIFESKFRKSRLIPIDESVIRALAEYRQLRNRKFPRCRVNSFFVTGKEFPVTYTGLHGCFSRIRRRLSWPSHQRRIHDFRHTFVVNRLVAWHRANEDTEQKIAALSVYVGHANVSATYWYFHMIPELLDLISKRFEMLGTISGGAQ